MSSADLARHRANREELYRARDALEASFADEDKEIARDRAARMGAIIRGIRDIDAVIDREEKALAAEQAALEAATLAKQRKARAA